MQTLSDFLHACKSTSSVDIYELFYNASDELRDAVYAEGVRLGLVLEDEIEPTRATMYTLGVHYKIKSMVEY